MSIEIKRSIKPIDYNKAIELLEKRIEKVINKTDKELIWFLEHNKIYTAGTSSVKSDILDKNVKIVKTSRGGKITCHSRGQLICYLVIDLTKRNKDIRKFIISLEN